MNGPPPSVVAIGGGHGLAATLRALRRLAVRPTAVVSVADDGGSTGRLRADAERAAPGDLRKCLVALAAHPSPLSRAMEHRYESGELKGHSFGNLLLAALEESEGDLLRALDVAADLLGTVGQVLPVTSQYVELVAELSDGTEVVGQERIADTPGIVRVWLQPEPRSCDVTTAAVAAADVVVLGPGSLYTSVLAAAVAPGITEAIEASGAPVVYVCNLRPQLHETDGYDVAAHVAALRRHGLHPDVVLYDPCHIGSTGDTAGAVAADLTRPSGLAHEPDLLAEALRVHVIDQRFRPTSA